MSVNFSGAPVCKALAAVTAAASFARLVLKLGPHMSLSTASLFHGQLWRPVTHFLGVGQVPDVVVAGLAIESAILMERALGSRKFAAALISTATITASLQLLTESILSITPTSGAAAVFVALTCIDLVERPSVKPWDRLKPAASMLYFSVFNGLSGALTAVSATLSALLWRAAFKDFAVPVILATKVGTVYTYFFGNDAPASATAIPRPGAGTDGARRRQRTISGQGQHYSDTLLGDETGPGRVLHPANEEQIQTLISMGFSRQQVMRVLQITSNNVPAAVELLLSGGAAGLVGGGRGSRNRENAGDE